MMTAQTQTKIAYTTIGLTASIAIALAPYKPDATTAMLLTLGLFVVVWNSTKLMIKRKHPGIDWVASKVRHEILFAIIIASLLLLGAMIATAAKQLDLIDGDASKRFIGINTGLMLVVLGNYMPKKNQATASQCGCSSQNGSINIQRFLGWTFVLGGLLYTLAWIALDLKQAGIAVMFVFPAAVVINVAVRFVYTRRSTSKMAG